MCFYFTVFCYILLICFFSLFDTFLKQVASRCIGTFSNDNIIQTSSYPSKQYVMKLPDDVENTHEACEKLAKDVVDYLNTNIHWQYAQTFALPEMKPC